MSPLVLVSFSVFLQLLCVGATFTTLEAYNASLGGSEAMLGALWLALSLPRGLLSPFWGGLSDRVGRRPILVVGAIATIAGSLCWAFAGGAWWMLLASRLVDSIFSAQAPVAMSVVADVTPPERRSAGMGFVGAMVGLAFSIGPLMGVASEWIGLANLGFAMAACQAGSLALVLMLPETRPADARKDAPLVPVLHAPSRQRALAHPAALPLLAVAFLMTASYGHFFSAFPLAAGLWYGWGVRETGVGFALFGFASVVAQGALVRPLVPRLGERALLLAGLPTMAAGFGVAALSPAPALLYVAIVLIAVGGGLAAPCVQGWLSRTAGPRDQGLLSGFSQTAQTVGRGLGPFLASLLFAAGAPWPFVAGAVIALACGAMAMRIPK